MPKNAEKNRCNICDVNCSSSSRFDIHILTAKHKNRTIFTAKNAENKEEEKIKDVETEVEIKGSKEEPEDSFYCAACNFTCSKKSNLTAHCSTAKHRNKMTSIAKINTENVKPDQIALTNVSHNLQMHKCCFCDKEYRAKNSLWYHKQKCSRDASGVVLENKMVVENTAPHSVFSDLLKEICISNAELNKQNAEFKQMIVDQQNMIMDLSNKPTTNNNITNSNINNISINMFLNEHCKNAMTIDDFANSIQISIDDITHMTQKGNREGLTAILTNAFNQLLITERPVHCTDTKRHTTYIKDLSGWNKENDQTHLNKLCRNIEHKCRKKTLDIMQEDSKYTKIGTPEYEHALKMMTESNGGPAGSEHNHNLVVKTLEESVGLDKQVLVSGSVITLKPNNLP